MDLPGAQPLADELDGCTHGHDHNDLHRLRKNGAANDGVRLQVTNLHPILPPRHIVVEEHDADLRRPGAERVRRLVGGEPGPGTERGAGGLGRTGGAHEGTGE